MKTFVLTFLFALPAFALSAGQTAPEFSAKNQNGKLVKSADLKGKNVVLYFYPKDQTPGCTREAAEFSKLHDKFKAANAVVLGVSRQDQASHREFIKAQGIPFDLLVDEKGEMAEKFNIGLIPVVGMHKRETVVIGADGKIAKIYTDVEAEGHAQSVLNDLPKSPKK